VPKRFHKKSEEIYTKLTIASELLLDNNLVWDSDFEKVREPLGLFLKAELSKGLGADPWALKIADILLEEEWDISA